MEEREIEARLEFVLFENAANGYAVARFKGTADNKEFTAAGRILNPEAGQIYKLVGHETEHKKYGKQLAVDTSSIVLPKAERAIIRFLSSSRFPGVGKKAAQKIYNHFGEDTLQTLAADPEQIYEVSDLSQELAQMLAERLAEIGQEDSDFASLYKLGLNPRAIAQLNKNYDHPWQVVQNDPFRPYYDIYGFGYQNGVLLADGVGLDPQDPQRLQARIFEEVKKQVFKTGNTFTTFYDLYESFLGLAPADFEESLAQLNEKDIAVVDGQRVYPYELHADEEDIAELLQAHLFNIHKPEDDRLEQLISQAEFIFNIEYDKVQKQAIKEFFAHSAFIINGGPGTGKSTIVKAILHLIKKLYPTSSIQLCAPTGRAAKRLSDLGGAKASTIHSVLRWDKDDNVFNMNEDNPLSCDFLICDEFSMVDTHVFASLLRALPAKCRILLIGDEEQLESVGPGKVFSDILASQLVKQVHLEKIFRQSSGSGIISLASQIHKDEPVRFEDGVQFVERDGAEIVEALVERLDPEMDLDEMQVLAPKYKGEAGIDQINKVLQAYFNPPRLDKREFRAGGLTFREGDKVMLLKNLPEDEVYNGDIGYVSAIEDQVLIVEFGEQVVSFDQDILSFLSLAYCVSVHKAQGSEFQKVFCIVSREATWMLNKKLLYTAVSRAKKELVIIGSENLFASKVKTRARRQRQTSLLERLDHS